MSTENGARYINFEVKYVGGPLTAPIVLVFIKTS